jgi:hypothetical protein
MAVSSGEVSDKKATDACASVLLLGAVPRLVPSCASEQAMRHVRREQSYWRAVTQAVL